MTDVKPSHRTIHPETILKTKEATEAALKGLKLGALLPEFKQPYKEERTSRALELLEKAQEVEPEQAKKLIQNAYDLLDDGKVNKSRVLPAKTAKRITQIASIVPVAAYVIYGIWTGDFDITALINLIGL